MTVSQFVFGYGSLAADVPARGGFAAVLPGWVRGWGVAMDNTRDEPGYKWYSDPAGARPAVHVCFLDIRPGDGSVNGACLPVGDAALRGLDARERNYVRVDVSAALDGRTPAGDAVDGAARVWAYVGSSAGRTRFAAGRGAGTAVIDAGYLAAVRAGFQALGADAWAACAASLDPDGIPVRRLVRHELT